MGEKVAVLNRFLERAPVDARRWSAVYVHRTHKGRHLDFDRHKFMAKIYMDESPYICHMKGTQAGSTEFLVWYAINQAILGRSVFYVLPTYNLVGRFVKNRVDRTVDRTPEYVGQVSREVILRRQSESMTLKHFGNGAIAFIGSNSPVGFTEFPADIAIEDEVDECDPENLEMVPERLAASDLRWRLRVGNPTIPDSPLDEAFKAGCRYRWHIRCEHCAAWVNPDFFRNVVLDEGEGKYRVRDEEWEPHAEVDCRLVCDRCGKSIGDRKSAGEWVAEDRALEALGQHSYHFSKLFTGTVTIAEILDRLERGTRDPAALVRFWNGDLGLPYMPKGANIDAEMMNACREDYAMPSKGEGGLTLCGIDVGARFHVWIARLANYEGGARLKSLYIGTVTNLREIMELLARYRVSCGVIDALPETRISRMVSGRHPGMFACFYGVGMGTGKHDLLQRKVVTVDRTASIDQAKEAVQSRFLMLPRDAEGIPDLYEQVSAAVRVFDQDANQGRGAWKWQEGTKKDHYLHALNYLVLSRSLAAQVQRRGLQLAPASGTVTVEG